jgi:lipopolysaccharide transport system permease protein
MTIAGEEWIENRPTSGRRAFDVAELVRYRELIWFLAVRDVKVRYKQAALGGVWAVAQPLAGAVIFTVVFGRLADVSTGDIPYLLFAYSGFALWTYFSTSVNTARTSLITNSSLITKVYFPRLAAPLASVLPGLIDLGVAVVVLVMLGIVLGVTPGVAIVALPLALLLTMAVALGAGTLLAALTVRYRDLQQVFSVVIQLWLFASPVAYPATLVEDDWQWVYRLNPIAGALDLWRWSLLDTAAPGPEVLVSVVVGIVLLFVGLRVFQQSERRFADVI